VDKTACDRCSIRPSLSHLCTRTKRNSGACSKCSQSKIVCKWNGDPILIKKRRKPTISSRGPSKNPQSSTSKQTEQVDGLPKQIHQNSPKDLLKQARQDVLDDILKLMHQDERLRSENITVLGMANQLNSSSRKVSCHDR
jgi:hypothetical protein